MKIFTGLKGSDCVFNGKFGQKAGLRLLCRTRLYSKGTFDGCYQKYPDSILGIRRENSMINFSQEGNWNNQGYGDIDANENMKSIVVNGNFRYPLSELQFFNEKNDD